MVPTVLLWLSQYRAEKAGSPSVFQGAMSASTSGCKLHMQGGVSVLCCWSCLGGATSVWTAAMAGAAGEQNQSLPEGKSSWVWLQDASPWLAQNRAEKAGGL